MASVDIFREGKRPLEFHGSTYPQHPWRIGNQEIAHFCDIWESWYPGNMVKTLFYIFFNRLHFMDVQSPTCDWALIPI
jgi:hypothetical protein